VGSRKNSEGIRDEEEEANVISTLPVELAQFTKLETLSVSQNRCVLSSYTSILGDI